MDLDFGMHIKNFPTAEELDRRLGSLGVLVSLW